MADPVVAVVDPVLVAVAVVEEEEVEAMAAPDPVWGLLSSSDLSPGDPGVAPRRTWRSRLVRNEVCRKKNQKNTLFHHFVLVFL